MLTTSQKHIVEKIIARDGLAYRVVFAVSNELGRIKAEVISATPLGKIDESSENLALPEVKLSQIYGEALDAVFVESILSPFTNSLFFSGSKPRAPTR